MNAQAVTTAVTLTVAFQGQGSVSAVVNGAEAEVVAATDVAAASRVQLRTPEGASAEKKPEKERSRINHPQTRSNPSSSSSSASESDSDCSARKGRKLGSLNNRHGSISHKLEKREARRGSHGRRHVATRGDPESATSCDFENSDVDDSPDLDATGASRQDACNEVVRHTAQNQQLQELLEVPQEQRQHRQMEVALQLQELLAQEPEMQRLQHQQMEVDQQMAQQQHVRQQQPHVADAVATVSAAGLGIPAGLNMSFTGGAAYPAGVHAGRLPPPSGRARGHSLPARVPGVGPGVGAWAQLPGVALGDPSLLPPPRTGHSEHERGHGYGHRHSQNRRSDSSRPEFKRVNNVWDNKLRAYKLQDTAEVSPNSQYEEYIFYVRRSFDWEGKYTHTRVDIKSKPLRECLQDVMGSITGINLVEETPKLDPNLLFLYLDDLIEHGKSLKLEGGASESSSRGRRRIRDKRAHLKLLVKYINEDYAAVKNSLAPMLANGLITFDLLWALWKPGTLAFTTTYGSPEPRVFKVETAQKHVVFMKGASYLIDGKCFQYDGEQFGLGAHREEIPEFRGACRINGMSVYPLLFHRKQEKLREELIERGKKFVSLAGVNYCAHQGLAFYKKNRSIIKVNVNGRIMIDPRTHRRMNPNYPVSHIRPKDEDFMSDNEDGDDALGGGSRLNFMTRAIRNQRDRFQIRMPMLMVEGRNLEKLDQIPYRNGKAQGGGKDEASGAEEKAGDEDAAEDMTPEFSDEEYLTASPVVLGFAFAEKLWLEFTVSGVNQIKWNETAYESLVLEAETKDIIKALVQSHRCHAAKSIDDVIQGKGKGLVTVLYGPPGTGKTLTAEGISELLKCPLYMVSAGELGTDARHLEVELQKIMDICHAWGAILLLDEADVFLEKRSIAEIQRNALVSIFLRHLEYFQGILFLTTNRVETFDDAFQSRIHFALRYDNLTLQAKKSIFKLFIGKVRAMEETPEAMPFAESDYNLLAQHEINGRQIKNTVRTAQALALNRGEAMTMTHIKQVLNLQMSFSLDLKGGAGYQDAMRSYS